MNPNFRHTLVLIIILLLLVVVIIYAKITGRPLIP